MRNDYELAIQIQNSVTKIFKMAEACGLLELVGTETDAEEILTAGNSFFDKSFFGTRILILAPHPDDEINIAGNMILTLAAAINFPIFRRNRPLVMSKLMPRKISSTTPKKLSDDTALTPDKILNAT